MVHVATKCCQSCLFKSNQLPQLQGAEKRYNRNIKQFLKFVINNKHIPFCETTEAGIEFFNTGVGYNVVESP